jgi:4-phytase/acid phosphatase
MLTSSHFLGAAIMSATMVAGGVALAAEYELVSTVIISRHGVRSPIAGHPALATFAADPWPSWPVPAGHLTPRGAALAKLLAGYYRAYYAAQGLFPANGCPPPGLVFAWADVDQRTLVTAQSLLDGMFPGCNLAPGSLIDAKIDPLFHPTRAGVCKVDPARACRSVTSSAGGSLASLRRTLRTEIAALQSVLKCCQPALCRAAGANAPCSLRNLPTAIVSEDSGNVRLSGPISIGSTASEVFLLEYAEGFPERQVAWGRASTPQAIRPLLRLHAAQFDLMERTPYLAARQGSALMERVLSTLQRAVDTSGTKGPVFTLLVGHDTNLANIGGMLRLHWSLPSYLADETPPAGAMHFELLRDRETKAHAIRVRYVAQTLDQMRRMLPLDLARPPETVVVKIDGCKVSEDGACPWTEFAKLANRAIDRTCVDSRH